VGLDHGEHRIGRVSPARLPTKPDAGESLATITTGENRKWSAVTARLHVASAARSAFFAFAHAHA
jgi:hypothetical protein